MNAGLAVLAADRVFEGRKEWDIPQAKPGETKFIGIAIRTQHGTITKNHKTLDAALGSIIAQ